MSLKTAPEGVLPFPALPTSLKTETTTMNTRYFDATCEGHKRIAEVTFDDELDCRSNFGREINKNDLPEDYKTWKRYTAHGVGNATVEVVSRHGD